MSLAVYEAALVSVAIKVRASQIEVEPSKKQGRKPFVMSINYTILCVEPHVFLTQKGGFSCLLAGMYTITPLVPRFLPGEGENQKPPPDSVAATGRGTVLSLWRAESNVTAKEALQRLRRMVKMTKWRRF